MGVERLLEVTSACPLMSWPTMRFGEKQNKSMVQGPRTWQPMCLGQVGEVFFQRWLCWGSAGLLSLLKVTVGSRGFELNWLRSQLSRVGKSTSFGMRADLV